MRIEPPASGWTHSNLTAVQLAPVELYYFTEGCKDCGQDALLSLELHGDQVLFRCPRCQALVPHRSVVACDEEELQRQGWFVREVPA